jgi:hypothetical protein
VNPNNYRVVWINPDNNSEYGTYIAGLSIVGSGHDNTTTFNPASTRVAVIKDLNGSIVVPNRNAPAGQIAELRFGPYGGFPSYGSEYSLVDPSVFQLIRFMESGDDSIVVDRDRLRYTLPPFYTDYAPAEYKRDWGYSNSVVAFKDIRIWAQIGIVNHNGGISYHYVSNEIIYRAQLNIVPMANGGRYDGGRTTPEWPGYSPEV